MDIIKDYIYSEEDFEEIQKNFNGKAEFDNGSIFLTSSTSIEHNRIKRKILAKLDRFFNGSKCEPFDEQIEVIFQNKDELYKYMAIKGYECSEEEKLSAIAFSEGIPGRIDRYFSDTELQELRDKIVDLLLQLTNNEIEAILEKEEQLVSYKQNKEEVINVLSSFIRDILVNKEVYNENLIINRDKIKEIERLTNEMSFKKLNKMLLGLQEARKNIKNNVSWAMTVRIMLMDFMEG